MFDVFSGSSRAYIADRFKVEDALAKWRKDNASFSTAAFEQVMYRLHAFTSDAAQKDC